MEHLRLDESTSSGLKDCYERKTNRDTALLIQTGRADKKLPSSDG
jgi:hypothetical protein